MALAGPGALPKKLRPKSPEQQGSVKNPVRARGGEKKKRSKSSVKSPVRARRGHASTNSGRVSTAASQSPTPPIEL